MHDNEMVKGLVEQYWKIGQHISNESTTFKNKLEPEKGLESSDLETMLEQIDIFSGTFGVLSDRIRDELGLRSDSV